MSNSYVIKVLGMKTIMWGAMKARHVNLFSKAVFQKGLGQIACNFVEKLS
jgi:hypothetical protein